MTAQDLTAMFQAAGVKPGALRKWARENYGVEIRDTTISRHKSGDQRILPFAEIVYKIFFNQLKIEKMDLKRYGQNTQKELLKKGEDVQSQDVLQIERREAGFFWIKIKGGSFRLVSKQETPAMFEKIWLMWHSAESDELQVRFPKKA